MSKKKYLVFFSILILLSNCSFDHKTGIWDEGKNEKKRIAELEKRQNESIDVIKVYSSEKTFSKEVNLIKKISLKKPKPNLSWEKPGLNNQNLLGNIFLPGTEKFFLKKK